jgi:hypothetical protein
VISVGVARIENFDCDKYVDMVSINNSLCKFSILVLLG